MQQDEAGRKENRGRGGAYKASIRAEGTRPPIGCRVGPTMVLVWEINMMLQIVLPVIKLHLSTKQLALILSVLLLLPLINSIDPQVEAGEMIIHVLIKVGSVEARGDHPSVAPGQRGVYSFSRGIASEPLGRSEPPSQLGPTPLGPTSPSPPPPPSPPTFPPWAGTTSSSDIRLVLSSKTQLEGVRDRGKSEVRERKEGKTMMTSMDLTLVHGEHLHLNTSGQIKPPPLK